MRCIEKLLTTLILLTCWVPKFSLAHVCYNCLGAECQTGLGRIEQCASKSDVCAVWAWRKDSPKHNAKAGDIYRKQCAIVLVVVQGCRVDGQYERCVCLGSLCNTMKKRLPQREKLEKKVLGGSVTTTSTPSTTIITSSDGKDNVTLTTTTGATVRENDTTSESPSTTIISVVTEDSYDKATSKTTELPPSASTCPPKEDGSGSEDILNVDEPNSEDMSKEIIVSNGDSFGVHALFNSFEQSEIGSSKVSNEISTSIPVPKSTSTTPFSYHFPLPKSFIPSPTVTNVISSTLAPTAPLRPLYEHKATSSMNSFSKSLSISTTTTTSTGTPLPTRSHVPSPPTRHTTSPPLPFTIHELAKSITFLLTYPGLKCDCGLHWNTDPISVSYSHMVSRMCRPFCTFCCIICCACVRKKYFIKQFFDG